MRKSRGKYKRSGRLGFNVILRRWYGKKKKWQGHILGQTAEYKIGKINQEENLSSGEKGTDVNSIVSPINPVVTLKNEERVGGMKGLKDGSGQSTASSRLRRKDIHGIQQSQKTGRKRIYGGIVGKTIQKNRSHQRKNYKEWKRRSDRNYRNGRLRSEYQTVLGESGENQKKQIPEVHRITQREIRADVRRWRSGRVPTLQIARDLIEHGKVSYVKGVSELEQKQEREKEQPVKWQGYKVAVGSGRKVNEDVWSEIKEDARKRIKQTEYNVTAAKYREVDYVTGRRVVLRLPESGEVVVPMGREVSLSTFM